MALYKIIAPNLSDNAALARNNMSACWTDPTWILIWRKGTTLEFIIENCTMRIPRMLLKDRVTFRHQKAVDPETGRLLGYARWVLPPASVVTPSGEPEWPEAQIPDVSPEERAEIERIAESAIWEAAWRPDPDDMDVPVQAIKHRILGEGTFMSLDYLAVHPENKGKGVATALVDSGVRQAEKMGIDIFILAFKAGVGVYKRAGFELVEQLIQDDTKWGGKGEYGTYFMVYRAKKE